MLRVARFVLSVLLVSVAGESVSAEVTKEPRLSQRPTVATPPCSEPKPYYVEHWTATSNMFYISLTPTIGREDADSEARRLAERHRFQIDGSTSLESGGGYFFAVEWLEPEQVAALRCESSVRNIDVTEEVRIVIPEVRRFGA